MSPNATVPAFSTAAVPSHLPSHRSLRRVGAGWAGVAVLVAFIVAAAGFSTSSVHAVHLPVPFFPFAALLVVVVARRWLRDVDDDDDIGFGARLFSASGCVVFFAWWSTALLNAWGMGWGADPLLLRLVETFHHVRDSVEFAVVAGAIVVLIAVAERPRLALVTQVLLAMGCIHLKLSTPAFALIVVSAQVCARRSLSFAAIVTMLVVALLGITNEGRVQFDGYGPFYGDLIARLACAPSAIGVGVGVCLACSVFGVLRWREHGGGFFLFVVAIVVVPVFMQDVVFVVGSSIGAAALVALLATPRRSTIVAVAVVVVSGLGRDIPPAAALFEIVLGGLLCTAVWAVTAQREAMTRLTAGR